MPAPEPYLLTTSSTALNDLLRAVDLTGVFAAGLLGGATVLATRLAAPMLVTMLIVDLVLGLVGKTMPQMNVMSAGLTLRSMVGMVIVIAGLSLTSGVIRDSITASMRTAYTTWTTPAATALNPEP